MQNAVQASGGYSPTVTTPGSRGLPANNLKQHNLVTNAWVNETAQYDNRIQVYPNPMKDEFKISNPSNSIIETIEVIDASGRGIKTFKAADTYNVSDLQKGTYILIIKSNQTTKITKLIKQ